jgi:uncharacterized membrane protein YkvI
MWRACLWCSRQTFCTEKLDQAKLKELCHMRNTARLMQRIFLPGLAFKAAVIGGGYATGRELASFFLPNGVRGGLYGLLLVVPIWSVVCALTFLIAFRTGSLDYRTFFRHLLGPLWWLFEIGWALAILVILAVFAAAAGEIGAADLGLPRLVGQLILVIAMAGCAAGGGRAVEGLFKWASVILYGIFAALFVLVLMRHGDKLSVAFSQPGVNSHWAEGGLAYAGYNIIGAVVVLPVTRHLTSERDAVVAGLISGPLAMIPAFLFFGAMVAYYPQIQYAALPSDFLLQQLNMPWFRIAFQVMIFCALLESGTSGLHAINERVAPTYEKRTGKRFTLGPRLGVSAAVLIGSVYIAGEFGLVALVASGLRWLSYLFLVIYVAPLLVYSFMMLIKRRPSHHVHVEAAPA